jgi:hypothetical protein
MNALLVCINYFYLKVYLESKSGSVDGPELGFSDDGQIIINLAHYIWLSHDPSKKLKILKSSVENVEKYFHVYDKIL